MTFFAKITRNERLGDVIPEKLHGQVVLSWTQPSACNETVIFPNQNSALPQDVRYKCPPPVQHLCGQSHVKRY